MAARKTTKKTKRTPSPRRTKKTAPKLSDEAKREITAVFLGALALLLSFAWFGVGGSLVTGMFQGLKVGIGLSAYLLPIICGALAWMLFQPTKYAVRGLNYFGFFGIIAGLSALLHVGLGANAQEAAAEGLGGGYLGLSISTWMLTILNVVASAIVLVALLGIFLILATGTNLKNLFTAIFSGFTREGKPVDEDTAEGKGLLPQLKINDNSGFSPTALPVRGDLNVGGKPGPGPVPPPAMPMQPVPAGPTALDGDEVPAKDLPKALTADSNAPWDGPSTDLLEATSGKADAGDVNANAKIIAQTMESFGIKVKMDEVNMGPTVTQYTFIPPAGVKLNKITGLDTNLALSLAAHPIRIEAPIPGKSAVGVELPNKKIALVRLRDVLSAPEVVEAKEPLRFVLGRDVSGVPMSADLAAMPHLLIAGATGSGKSVMINTLLTSLLYRNSPDKMKLILVDPKRVELGLYNDIPHLLTPVIVEPEKCISALKWAVGEMTSRYILLEKAGNRNIVEYNKDHTSDSLPYIVIVIDELADLMVLAAADVETLIVRLAQMARAVGIHLVLATQRPSVDVITGIIKANIPARLAFSVASQIDSRTILDQMGAEKLLGRGDMLFASPEFIKPRRIQGVFIDEKETKAITDYLRTARKPDFLDEVLAQKVNMGGRSGGGGGDIGGGDDELFVEAAEAVISNNKASASMLQRRLKVGYSRAARLMDELEEKGVISGPDQRNPTRPRDVLISSLDQIHAVAPAGSEVMRPAEPYEE